MRNPTSLLMLVEAILAKAAEQGLCGTYDQGNGVFILPENKTWEALAKNGGGCWKGDIPEQFRDVFPIQKGDLRCNNAFGGLKVNDCPPPDGQGWACKAIADAMRFANGQLESGLLVLDQGEAFCDNWTVVPPLPPTPNPPDTPTPTPTPNPSPPASQGSGYSRNDIILIACVVGSMLIFLCCYGARQYFKHTTKSARVIGPESRDESATQYTPAPDET